MWGSLWSVKASECHTVSECGGCPGQGQGLSWVCFVWEGF